MSPDAHGRGAIRRDGDQRLQSEYDFLPAARKNHWMSLFVDRRPLIAQISDQELLAYIDRDNYSDLAGRLENEDRLQACCKAYLKLLDRPIKRLFSKWATTVDKEWLDR